MMDSFKVAIIPLDNRPVSYDLPVQTLKFNRNVEVFIPPIQYVGGLEEYADVEKIFVWLENTLKNDNPDYIVCCLDTLAYGGLIPSRRSDDSYEVIKNRLLKFKSIIESCTNKPKIYAFSSIMRISNNNVNEEEKLYWDKYGELLFKYSFLSNKIQSTHSELDIENLRNIADSIPDEILQDYLSTRKRNFDINKLYLEWIEEDFFEYFVYSQDDTAQFGLNVFEKNILSELILEKNISDKAVIKTGADEIPTSLAIRGICDLYNFSPSIFPLFPEGDGKNIISRYEDITIEKSVHGQIELCGAKLSESFEKADIMLVLNTPDKAQCDHAMKLYPEEENIEQILEIVRHLQDLSKPLMLADIKCANGADNKLVSEILKSNIELADLYGFAAWNTTGNALGSVISMAVSRFVTEKKSDFDLQAFKNLMFVRFADDWAYQAIARQIIRALTSEADKGLLYQELMPYLEKFCDKFDVNCPRISLRYPWNRTFEVGIDILSLIL